MTKRLVKVNPDHLASGLWIDGEPNGRLLGKEMSTESLHGVVSKITLVALRMWVETWEFILSKGEPDSYDAIMSRSFYQEWEETGRILTEELNASQDIYEFVYVPTYDV